MKLDIADKGVHSVGELLINNNYQARLVGGAVRDMLLGKIPKDMDLATDALPEDVIKIAESYGYRVIPTGLQHGTVTIVVDGEGYEVTTLRKDVETNGRHAVVEYINSFEDDASRRDFTFNAMSATLDGTVHDYFGGSSDLNNKVVKFVGNADNRIEEDYLRILRFFRFRARYGGLESDDTLQPIERAAFGLSKISVERIWSEMSKIIAHPNGVDQLMVMDALGVNNVIGFSYIDKYLPLMLNAQKNGVSAASLIGILSADVDRVEDLAVKWKFSNSDTEEAKVAALITSDNNDNTHYWLTKIVNGMDKNIAIPILTARGNTEIAEALQLETPVFPLKGRDLIDFMDKGSEMGRVLKNAREKWIESEFTLTKEDLINEIKGDVSPMRRF